MKEILTGNSIFLVRIQNPLVVNTLGQIVLRFLAQFKVFHGHLTDKLKILFKLFSRGQVIVVKLHTGYVRVCSGTHAERGHSTPVHVQSTVWEEVEEETVVWFLGVRDVLGEIVLVVHGVECGRVVDGE